MKSPKQKGNRFEYEIAKFYQRKLDKYAAFADIYALTVKKPACLWKPHAYRPGKI